MVEANERIVMTPIDADVRAVIVRQLGGALAEAWRRQHKNDERAGQLATAAARDVHEGVIREPDEPITASS